MAESMGGNPVGVDLARSAADELRREQGGSCVEGSSEDPHKGASEAPDGFGWDNEGGGGGRAREYSRTIPTDRMS